MGRDEFANINLSAVFGFNPRARMGRDRLFHRR